MDEQTCSSLRYNSSWSTLKYLKRSVEQSKEQRQSPWITFKSVLRVGNHSLTPVCALCYHPMAWHFFCCCSAWKSMWTTVLFGWDPDLWLEDILTRLTHQNPHVRQRTVFAEDLLFCLCLSVFGVLKPADRIEKWLESCWYRLTRVTSFRMRSLSRWPFFPSQQSEVQAAVPLARCPA